jgi:hypothetical protein
VHAGFCGETDEEHAGTVDLMRSTKYDAAFMFAYSQREKTSAARHLQVRIARGGHTGCMYVQRETLSLLLFLRNMHSIFQAGGKPRPCS